jgi:hypothetical protein
MRWYADCADIRDVPVSRARCPDGIMSVVSCGIRCADCSSDSGGSIASQSEGQRMRCSVFLPAGGRNSAIPGLNCPAVQHIVAPVSAGHDYCGPGTWQGDFVQSGRGRETARPSLTEQATLASNGVSNSRRDNRHCCRYLVPCTAPCFVWSIAVN